MRREPTALGAAMENYKTRRFGPLTVGGNYSSALLPIVDLQSRDGSALLEEIMQSVPPAVPGSFDEDLTSFVLSVLRNHQKLAPVILPTRRSLTSEDKGPVWTSYGSNSQRTTSLSP